MRVPDAVGVEVVEFVAADHGIADDDLDRVVFHLAIRRPLVARGRVVRERGCMAEAESGERRGGQDAFRYRESQVMLAGSQLQVREDLFAEELVVRGALHSILTGSEPTVPCAVCVEVDPGVEVTVARIGGRIGHGDRNRIVLTGDEELRPDDTVFVVEAGRVVAGGGYVRLSVEFVVDFVTEVESGDQRVPGAVVDLQGRIAG